MDISNDWRITNQKEYLLGKSFKFSKYKAFKPGWDHDHCEFCLETIGSGGYDYGYCTDENYRWVCNQCYNDFRIEFEFIRI